MLDLFKDLFAFFTKLMNNANFVNIISIIVVAISSYHVAKYNASKPEKLKIKQLQLSNVYLPLHRILEHLPLSPSRRDALEILNKLTNILDKNYELAFPKLHTYCQMLKSDIVNNNDYSKMLKIIKHQVDTDYELLKKSLGYPSENFHNIYIRMTFKQKATFIVSWINVLWLFIPCIIFAYLIPYIPQNAMLIMLIMFGLVIASLLLILKINSWLKNLKD